MYRNKIITILLLASILLQVFAFPLAALAQTPTAPVGSGLCGLTAKLLDLTGLSSLYSSIKSKISGFIGGAVGKVIGKVTGGVVAGEIVPVDVYANPQFPADVGTIRDDTGTIKGNTSALVQKEFVCDPVLRFIATILIRSLTDSIIGWIQGGEVSGGNVGFIGNFETALKNEANIRGGEFLNALTGINLCGNIGAFLQISLRTSTSLRQRFACTVTDIVANVEDFFNDFSKGGWPAFIRISLQPQNNPYGAFLIALDAKTSEEAAALTGFELRAKTGIGYEGQYLTIRRCTDSASKLPPGTVFDPISQEKQPDGSVRYCYTEKLIKTPGHLVANLLHDTFKSNIDFAVVADEINEAIEAIITALIGELISGGASGGIFNPRLTTSGGLPKIGDDLEVLTIITYFLPAGTVGVSYSTQLSVINGVLPYSWSIISGALPAGLTLDIDGLISGTPTAAGIFSFTVRITDAAGTTDTQTLTLEILAAPAGSPPPPGLPPAQQNLTVTPLVCNTALPANVLSWDSYPQATSYDIFMCQGENCVFPVAPLTNSAQTTYSHLGVFTNTSYSYNVLPFIGATQTSVPGAYPIVSIRAPSCP